MYNFASGPLVWIAFIVFVGGMVAQIGGQVGIHAQPLDGAQQRISRTAAHRDPADRAIGVTGGTDAPCGGRQPGADPSGEVTQRLRLGQLRDATQPGAGGHRCQRDDVEGRLLVRVRGAHRGPHRRPDPGRRDDLDPVLGQPFDHLGSPALFCLSGQDVAPDLPIQQHQFTIHGQGGARCWAV